MQPWAVSSQQSQQLRNGRTSLVKGNLGKTQGVYCSVIEQHRGRGLVGTQEKPRLPWSLRREMMKERGDPLLPITPPCVLFLQPRICLLPGQGYQRQVSAWWAGRSWEGGSFSGSWSGLHFVPPLHSPWLNMKDYLVQWKSSATLNN